MEKRSGDCRREVQRQKWVRCLLFASSQSIQHVLAWLITGLLVSDVHGIRPRKVWKGTGRGAYFLWDVRDEVIEVGGCM